MTLDQLFELQARNRGATRGQTFVVHGLLINALDTQHAHTLFDAMSVAEREQWPNKQCAVSVAEADAWRKAWHNGNAPTASAKGGRSKASEEAPVDTADEVYARRNAVYRAAGAHRDVPAAAVDDYAFRAGIYEAAGRGKVA